MVSKPSLDAGAKPAHDIGMTDPERPLRPGPPLDRSWTGSISDAPPDQSWVSIAEAAAMLGVSEAAVRSKIKRRTLRATKGNDGRLRVLVEPHAVLDRSKAKPGPVLDRSRTGLFLTEPPDQGEAFLRAEVATLRERLTAAEQCLVDAEAHAAERLADRDRLIEQARADHQAELERLQQIIDRLTAPWWRRWFKG